MGVGLDVGVGVALAVGVALGDTLGASENRGSVIVGVNVGEVPFPCPFKKTYPAITRMSISRTMRMMSVRRFIVYGYSLGNPNRPVK